ncbi:MAG TPA: hypothetical protein VFQ40_00880 [Actinomycetota bacterium]|nr:hypothetical protein [Actinomycetota bacterium]
MDEPDRWTEVLSSAWALPDGALYRLRQGELDVARIDELIRFLRTIAIPHEATIPKRLVSLLWMLPDFMEWQVDRVIERGGSGALRTRAQLVRNEVERILGMP